MFSFVLSVARAAVHRSHSVLLGRLGARNPYTGKVHSEEYNQGIENNRNISEALMKTRGTYRVEATAGWRRS